VLIGKRLIESRYLDEPIKAFGQDQKAKAKKKLIADLPSKDKKGNKQGKR
jgi:hypothetical protein